MPQNAELYHTCMLQAGLSPANPNPDPSLSPSLSPSPSLRSRSRLRHNPNPRSNPNQMCNFLPEANKRQDLPPLHAESAMAPRLARRLDHRPLSRRTHATHVTPHTTEEGKAEHVRPYVLRAHCMPLHVHACHVSYTGCRRRACTSSRCAPSRPARSCAGTTARSTGTPWASGANSSSKRAANCFSRTLQCSHVIILCS